MRFVLYCGRDPTALGIEDAEGNWDLGKFKEHIRRCRKCSRFLVSLGAEFLVLWEIADSNRKGSPGCDCP